MITSLFKPAWKSDSIDKRLGAIASLNSEDAEDQQILLELSNDPEHSVVVAAVTKITSIERLLELTNSHSSDQVRGAAKDCLVQLLGAHDKLDDDQCMQLLKNHPQLCPYLATYAASGAIRQHAIDALSDDQLLEILQTTSFTDSRQQIAQRLDGIHELESARKFLRGKDKNAEKILKGKIDEIRRQEREQAERQATVKKLIEDAEYLANHDWLPEFKSRVDANRNLWDGLGFEVASTDKQRYLKSRSVFDARYEEQRLIDETRSAREKLLQEISTLLRSISDMDIEQATQALEPNRAQLDGFIIHWEKLQHLAPAEAPQEDSFKRHIKQMNASLDLMSKASAILAEAASPAEQESGSSDKDGEKELSGKDIKQLESALKELRWPKQGELRIVALLKQKIQHWHEARKAAMVEQEQKLAQLHKKISAVFRFSRQGNLARARQTLQRAEKAFAAYSGKEKPKLEDRLKDARETLNKMDDWKDFATEPKYIELCEAMEKLVDSKLHPDNLSGKIKALQKKWKELGYSHISDNYWSRFKEAADQAYKPCAEFFAERHDERHDNLEKRQQYVEQMRTLLEDTDWDNDPDYKSAQNAVHKISDHFIAIKDVERGAGQKQWKAFSKLRDGVYAQLDVAYEKNIGLKHQLVEQMKTLAEAEPREENLATLKNLQTRWKHIGITRRGADQKAWKQFKKQGDIVYNNVRALRQSHRSEMDQQLEGYRNIIRDIQKLAKTATDLAQADHRFSELQAAYSALPELPHTTPEKLVHGIQRDFKRACNQFDERHQGIVDGLHEQQIEALRQKADLCLKLEDLGAEPDANRLQKLTEQWESIDLHDSELARRIEARRAAAHEVADRDEIAAQRRLFCIKLEIATGLDSPAQDRELRTQYQLEQMNKSGLGQQAFSNDGQLEQMEIDWLCMPGAGMEQQQALDERFRRTLKNAK